MERIVKSLSELKSALVERQRTIVIDREFLQKNKVLFKPLTFEADIQAKIRNCLLLKTLNKTVVLGEPVVFPVLQGILSHVLLNAFRLTSGIPIPAYHSVKKAASIIGPEYLYELLKYQFHSNTNACFLCAE